MQQSARFRHKVLLPLIASFAALICAGQAQAEAGWTAYGSVLELQPTTQGRFVFRMRVDANPSGCRKETWFYRDYRGLGAEQVYATLLEATSRGRAIKVYVTGVCDLNGYSEINSVSLSGP